MRLRRAAVSQQLAFGQLADHRPLRRSTLARLTPSARSAAKAALRASGALSRIVRAEHRFPNWRIIAPPPPDQLLSYYRAAAAVYRIPWQYLAAVELVETRMGRIPWTQSGRRQGAADAIHARNLGAIRQRQHH